MIRRMEKKDLDEVSAIWLNSNTNAHSFIPAEYWEKNLAMVKELLPQAEVYVYEKNYRIAGFIGLNENYIEGLFVSEKLRSQGIGKRLLDYVKDNHAELSLSVYRKNEAAVRFYKQEKFSITGEGFDENTSEPDYQMCWETNEAD
ncbi:MAG: N-acetyltransferase [Eubacterium sp.]